jgi:hypothetical protein
MRLHCADTALILALVLVALMLAALILVADACYADTYISAR